MKLLIIGGTRFLGRALVEAGLAAGHELTLFNRGQSNPGLFPDVEEVHGNRDGGLGVLAGRRWDAVIDTCGYVPRLVGASAEFLKDAVEHYTFVSSISVYANFATAGMDESAPVGKIEDETTEQITNESYGPLKALCERAASTVMGEDRALHIRAGLIVGPYDLSDRFTYWPYRVAKGGDVLAPGSPDAPVQIVDVRDLAQWMIRAAAAGLSGPYNATGPERPLTMAQVLQTCQTVSSSDATFVWVSDAFLQTNEVGPYVEMPLWIPTTEEDAGFDTINCQKAIKDGLAFRPLAETVEDTLSWLQTRPSDYQWRGGLKPEREAELLLKWRAG